VNLPQRDENTCRKDFSLSEAVSVGKMLEALERPKARARQNAAKAESGQKVGARERAENFSAPEKCGENGRTLHAAGRV